MAAWLIEAVNDCTRHRKHASNSHDSLHLLNENECHVHERGIGNESHVFGFQLQQTKLQDKLDKKMQ